MTSKDTTTEEDPLASNAATGGRASSGRDSRIDPLMRAAEQAVRMQRVTAKLSEATGLHEVASALLRESQAITRADRSCVQMLNDRGDCLALVEQIGCDDVEEDLLNLAIPSPSRLHMSIAMETQRPVIAQDSEAVESEIPDAIQLLNALNVQAVAAFPLVVGNRVIGVWSLGWDKPQQIQEGEVIIMLTLASQCAQTLERARLFERERFISLALQRTLIPEQLPTISGANMSRRYIPAAQNVRVGGDWYDVLALPNNHVLAVIGDVGGHDVIAAAVMGQLRNAIRSYAWEGHIAAKVLQYTNSLLCELEPGVMATCCIIDLGLSDGLATIACAGHPPPLIANPTGSASFLELAADPPLGTFPNFSYGQTSVFIDPLEAIALYTDGLVESRDLEIEVGMSNLKRAAESECDEQSTEHLADCLMKAATNNRVVEDDMALLILQFDPQQMGKQTPSTQRVQRTLPSDPSSPGLARRFAADVLAEWGAEDAVDTIQLCVSELVTNALIHTADDFEIVITNNTTTIEVEVIDKSDRMPPEPRPRDEHETTGRGLFIVASVAADWGVRPIGTGKAIWFSVDRTNVGSPS